MRARIEALEDRIVLSTFTVSNTLDSGAGSLRQAITDANNHPGVDTIAFSIGSGAQTISPLSALPDIGDAVIIDGTTQPGYNGKPIIELSGGSCSAQVNGLTLAAGNSTVKGLVVNSWKASGLASVNNGNNIIQNCYFGTDLTGLVAKPNSFFGIYCGTGGNVVGGSTVAARNVISGNSSIGLFFNGGGGSTAQGNYIGLGADGVTRVGNGGTGLDCQDGAGNLIGGTNPGEGNVISGNLQDGVLLYGTADFTRIFGNLIGSDYTGTVPIGNHDWGIECQSAHNVIGGIDPGTRNLLSANGGSGIVLYSENVTKSMFNTVQGNYIGTDITGTKALGQSAWLTGIQQQGISFSFDAHDNLIGGTNAAARNIISGNVEGIGIFANATHNTVQGNYIGTDYTGFGYVGNTNGIIIFGATDNTIGGMASGAGNLISASIFDGVLTGSDNTTIQGNLFGTYANGGGYLPNGEYDINTSNASNVLIGGPSAAAGNVIVNSGQDGIHFHGGANNTVQNNFIGVLADGTTGAPNLHNGIVFNENSGSNVVSANVIRNNAQAGIAALSGVKNRITGNSIVGNGALGIDLNADGVTPNAPGPRTGPNNLQNYPVLASSSGGNVAGTLNAVASSTFTLEFYWSPTADASGFGQGQTSMGTITVTTDVSGNATFSFPVPAAIASGVISATATDASGNTSEFSHVVGYTAGTSAATVVNRAIFYNNSLYDGNDAGANATSDNTAIAPDKRALLPGQAAAFANFTSYDKGINGVIIDVANLPASGVTAADFTFAAGNTTTPGSWAAAPAPASVTVFPGAGINGSDRIEIIWPDYSMRNEWLQVTMNANGNTGLATADTFYFGNLVGKTAATTSNAMVSIGDVVGVKFHSGQSATITSPYDLNRDGQVSIGDIVTVKFDQGHTLAFPFTPPAPPAPQIVKATTATVVKAATAATVTAPSVSPKATPAASPVLAFKSSVAAAKFATPRKKTVKRPTLWHLKPR
jgi:titin